MKVLFFGLGSIGNRHARLLKAQFQHSLLAFRSNEGRGKNPLGLRELYTWDDVASECPDVAFVTNPTHLHLETIGQALDIGIRSFFIEKPIDISDQMFEKVLERIRTKGAVTYVAYVMRFHPIVRFLKDWIRDKDVHHVRCVNSSYLPDWRPGQDFSRSYSRFSDQGGGVILDASHEFDMLTYLFGPIRKITGEFGRIADITYDAEDYAEAMVLCGKTTASVYLSYFGKPAQRVISIETSTGRLEADLLGGGVVFCGEPYRTFEINRDQWYLDQLAYFFDNIGNPGMMNRLEEASQLFKMLVQFRSTTSHAGVRGSRKSAPNT